MAGDGGRRGDPRALVSAFIAASEADLKICPRGGEPLGSRARKALRVEPAA
jgi:hypothetical protein